MNLKILTLWFCFACALSCTKKSKTPASSGSSTDLIRQKWIIYQYKDGATTAPLARNDTLLFVDLTNYKYNMQNNTYSLTYNDYLYTHLTLNGTPFGDLVGTVPNNFIQNAEIIDVPFSQLKVSGALTYHIWIKKL